MTLKITVEERINTLGLEAKDMISGFTGVISTVGFDVNGCVQAYLSPKIEKDGKLRDGAWFDFARLNLSKRVLHCDYHSELPPKVRMRVLEGGNVFETGGRKLPGPPAPPDTNGIIGPSSGPRR